MAHSTRPQLASAPNMAALTRLEATTALARRSAASSERERRTWQGDQPAGPLAVGGDGAGQRGAHRRQRVDKEVIAFILPLDLFIAGQAVGRMTAISLVEVSPSTQTRLKVFLVTS